ILFQEGRLRESEGQLQAAAHAYGRALQLEPKLHLARLHLAACLERSGDPEHAAAQYARALEDAQAQGRWLNAETTSAVIRSLVQHAVLFVRSARKSSLSRLLAPLVAQHGAAALERVEHCLRIYLRVEPAQYPDPRQKPTFLYFPGLPPAAYLDRCL